MSQYLVVVAAVFAANVVPAFAPPTWSLLVWFELSFELSAFWLVAVGVASATAGRTVLAFYMRRSTRWMPAAYVANMETAGAAITKTRGRTLATLALFFFSPLSSAQLFAAAGIMKTMRIRPLMLAFALGRTVTYSFYVAGAHAVKKSSVGDIVLEQLRSPWAIVVQVLMVLLVVLLGMKRWGNGESPQSASKE